MTLLANRPIETPDVRTSEPAPRGGAYVTTHSPRPAMTGSYVATERHGKVPAEAIRGRYVTLAQPPLAHTEGSYTDRG